MIEIQNHKYFIIKLNSSIAKKILCGFLSLFLCHCASIKKWWSGDNNENVVVAPPVLPPPAPVDETIRFSENPNVGTFNDRRYKRSTRKSLEEESDVGSRAGSLWNTEGPSAYLFTQNKLHREGDLLNVKLEGNARSQMETKIGVIKKLLARLEIVNSQPTLGMNSSGDGAPNEAENGLNDPSSNGRDPAGVNKEGKSAKTLIDDKQKQNSVVTNSTNNKADNTSELDVPINVDSVPTRVAERMGDGNYRVKGHQSFMIGKKEFRVILTGLVRPEDFSDEGISSNKLLDPQLDIVSLRRSVQ